MSTQPELVLPEQLIITPVSRRVSWLLVAVLTLCIVGSGAGAFLAWGDRVYYRQWNSVRTWSRPADDVDVRLEGRPEDRGRRYLWYAAMHRSAQRSIRMNTHNDFSPGMVLVVLPREAPERSSVAENKGGRVWYLTETVEAPGLRARKRELVVEAKLVRLGQETFNVENGRLVLIDEAGNATQHVFETDAQNVTQMQAAIADFLGARSER